MYDMRVLYFLLLWAFPIYLASQIPPTSGESRLLSAEKRKAKQETSMLRHLEAVSLGPSVFSGRVTDIEANPADPTEMYVAYASGGLWYSNSNGTRFEPVFDREASMTIGDIAVDWERRVVWVGTGENNSSRSSYSGTGMYRSGDGGRTWSYRGLPESHHIGRIVLHPNNPDIIWVAVLGHLYSANPERGVYRTTDGGASWQRTLFVGETAGAIDLIMDPGNTDVLYAATWERDRTAWHFNGAGEGSGIWKSIDSGQTWSRINLPNSGFPHGSRVGRIGLSAARGNGRTVLYACLDNQEPGQAKEKKQTDELTKEQLRTMPIAELVAMPELKLEQFLKKNSFPKKYTAGTIIELAKTGSIKPITLVEYLEDANTQLFEADYIGAEVYRSDDNGQSWYKTHDNPLEQINFTYGYYFSNIRCAPDDPEKVYLLGFYVVRSDDGGKTWNKLDGDNVHVDHHALWVNPIRRGHLINGNDGGLNISWDDGVSWMLCNTPPVGQFYTVAVDEEQPYNVYGGAQDNGVWVGPSTYKASTEWHQEGDYPYRRLMGGDGMQVAIDTRDNGTVYTGYQFGNYFRLNRKAGSRPTAIKPRHELGERPLRFNWQTPIHLSRHQQDILYIGAQKVFRSMDKGNNWEAISGDLTLGGKPGNVPFGTLTSIQESPLQFGLLYAGSDDGLLHISTDGGQIWTRISDSLPPGLWVSRVVASGHERGRAYVALNGYRSDHFDPYIYCSEDYGKTWERLGADLPIEPVNVIREDPSNPNVLYVGTDHGVYISLDRGKRFEAVTKGLPDVPVHDLVVQGVAKELVIGTHGRSLYKLDIAHVQGLTEGVLQKDLHLFPVAQVKHNANWGRARPWEPLVDPSKTFVYCCREAGPVRWRVETTDGTVLQSGEAQSGAGLNEVRYNLDIREEAASRMLRRTSKIEPKIQLEQADSGKFYLPPGQYVVVLEKSGKTVREALVVVAD
jgi:photosystem II stability/assembly factor-like uncharacterized protein